MQQTNSKSIIIFLSILFLLAAILGTYSWRENSTLKTNNKYLNTQVSELKDTRDDLETDVRLLEEEFEELATSSKKQKKELEDANNKLTSSKTALRKLQKKYKKDIGWMKAEIRNLREAKKELTELVALLKKERETGNIADGSLLDSRLSDIELRNKELLDELGKTKAQNNALENENKNLDVAAIVATSTRVDIRKKGNKPTGSFRRAREIIISFNLSHLAKSKEGVNNLYVVIKDAKGNLVKVDNPVKKKITSEVNGSVNQIIAQQMITADLFDKVRLAFKVKPKRRTLKKGYYRVNIYADWGLVGRTEFDLR
jgi:DNA repair exonuclease SbcCD ATPase subunit